MRKKGFFAAVLLALAAAHGFCDELTAEQVSNEALQGLLKAEYAENARIDDDGDLRIELEGLKLFVTYEENREFIKIYSLWGKGEYISENRLLRVLNEWNREKIFGAVSANGNIIQLTYFLSTEGGLNGKNFNGTLEWIVSVAGQFSSYLRDEDAL